MKFYIVVFSFFTLSFWTPYTHADGNEYTDFPTAIDLMAIQKFTSELVGRISISTTTIKLELKNPNAFRDDYDSKKRKFMRTQIGPDILGFLKNLPSDAGQIKKAFHEKTTTYLFTDANKLIVCNLNPKNPDDPLHLATFQLSKNYYGFGKIVGAFKVNNKLYLARQEKTGRIDVIDLATGQPFKTESFAYGIASLQFDPGSRIVFITTRLNPNSISPLTVFNGLLPSEKFFYMRTLQLKDLGSDWTCISKDAIDRYKYYTEVEKLKLQEKMQ